MTVRGRLAPDPGGPQCLQGKFLAGCGRGTAAERDIGGCAAFGGRDARGLASSASRRRSPPAPNQKNDSSLVITSDGRAFEFGGHIRKSIPTLIPTKNPIVQGSVSETHSLFLDNIGNVYSFGDPMVKSMPSPRRDIPIILNLIWDKQNIVQVGAGRAFSLLLDNEGKVYITGPDSLRLVLGEGYDTTKFHMITDIDRISQFSVSKYHFVLLTENGEVYVFGDNFNGELGLGTTSRPVPIRGLPMVRPIELLIGYEGKFQRFVPTKIPKFNKIKSVSMGNNHSLILDDQGKAYSFGSNDYGQLGLGGYNFRDSPTLISGITNIVQVAAGGAHSLILNNEGKVYAFGNGMYGQLGLDDVDDANVPMLIPDLNNIVEIAAGGNHSLALDKDGNVYSFGYNDHGQLGIITEMKNIPTIIPKFNIFS